ncbi:hypothetical protein [Flavilitoribacter nigricans]|uniref:Uncharacterized protein n=1 Tax=Flavilitoribacter nigricans (strain ATCC 23147 / DSM 23189 / NBRC 102662 / NCIMB 1420 / SS-2) TaxID=1122177 RepID=A0A2D0MZY2_FLAN2|nr:hypothetical protein [Flavilitoribacter nigricans]PHN01686.1 hypothetical protein CRP01_35655 [Flavilitoribacter nigricans DSM 23189 = NBRC 102662]
MKNQSVVQHILGFNEVFDRISRINLRLPQNFRIYVGTDKVWIGGKDDGSSYLHIEKISAKALELTKPLADGDLDIQVYPQGHGSETEEGVVSQKVACTLRGEKLSGLWLRVAFDEDYHYLILLAGKSPEQYVALYDAGMEIAQGIRSQVPKTKFIRQYERPAVAV